MGFFFGRKGTGIPKGATFRITQAGTEKLQEFGSDPKSQILAALETRGSSDVQEIAQASGLSRGKVERFIPTLAKGAYIQYVKPGGGAEELD